MFTGSDEKRVSSMDTDLMELRSIHPMLRQNIDSEWRVEHDIYDTSGTCEVFQIQPVVGR